MDNVPRRPCILLQPDQASFASDVAGVGAQPLVLAPLPREAGAGDAGLCAPLVKEARAAAGPEAMVAGQIFAGGLLLEPYGETPLYDGVMDCRALGRAFAAAGADCLLIHGARSLLQARAALLGVRACGLPVLCTFEILGEGESLLGGGDILSAFLVLQELGAAAVGFCSSVTGLQLDALELAAPFRKVPLISMTENLADALEPEDNTQLLARRADGLSALGVSMLGIMGGRLHHMTAAGASIQMPGLPASPLAGEIWTANETQVYYLDENVEFSEPVECSLDMSDAIIETERDDWGVLCIRVESPEEGDSISLNNAHLSRMPVAFSSDDEAALEAALFAYNGRAILDSRSELPEDKLEALARRYGGVVL